jgi:hypothetical protein
MEKAAFRPPFQVVDGRAKPGHNGVATLEPLIKSQRLGALS